METIALLLINVDSRHFFAANLLGIRENESEERNYFPLFKKERLWNQRGREVVASACPGRRMLLHEDVSGPTRISPSPRDPTPFSSFLEKKKKHDKLDVHFSRF